MMSDMDAGRPMQGRPGGGYGAYEGQQQSYGQSVPPYETAYQQPALGETVDDNLVEAISQRVAQQMAQQSRQSAGKVYGQKQPSSMLPAGLRGAIAIVSVVALVPLGLALGLFDHLVALAIVGGVILLVNAIVNGVLSSHD